MVEEEDNILHEYIWLLLNDQTPEGKIVTSFAAIWQSPPTLRHLTEPLISWHVHFIRNACCH